MEPIFQSVIKYKRSIFIAFLIVAIASGVLSTLVPVNYDMVDYLPQDAQSTIAIKVMEKEFDGEMPNARILLTDLTVLEALAYKEKIAAIDGVKSIEWLDDIIGLDTLKTIPVEFLDASIIENYYKDNNALMTVSIESGKETSAVNVVYDLIGEDNAIAGDAVNTAESQAASVSEVMNAMAILLPIIIFILILSTSSWIEPVLFLLTIGIAIVINMGTNIIFDEISFITLTVSPILQLAVSLDYAIFLLHSFNKYRSTHEPQTAMVLAMKQAIPTVAASAATTIIGFGALIFMRFGIGADLGINLLKGISLSFISVALFLPAVTMLFYKAIDKTKHRNFMPDFKKSGSLLMKVRVPFLILTLIIVIPSFLAQSNTEFLYGMGDVSTSSRAGKDALHIEEKFGRENPMVLLVPNGHLSKEVSLSDALAEIPHVTSVVSYVTAIGAEIPLEFVPEEVTEHFYSENYARIVLYTDAPDEGEIAFATVQSVLDTAAMHYDAYYLTGQSATLYDMSTVVAVDTGRVNLIALIGMFIVLLLTFRSLSIPVFLLFTIKTAIWINLSMPYFSGEPINFIGYLIVSTVQLGATVDYAILLTHAYMNNRQTLSKKEAMRVTIGDNLIAILISAIILASAGFILALTTSNPLIYELGMLLGRGTILSVTLVACVLPALLVLFDKLIQKTTINNKFY